MQDGEKVRDFAQRALGDIERLGLLPTPEAFTIWFSYHADSNPGLARALRATLERDGRIDNERCRELFERHIGTAAQERQLQAASSRLGDLAQRLSEEVCGLSAGAERYGASLDAANRAAASVSDREQIIRLVASILAETNLMQGHARRLEDHLVESTNHIRDLRRDLREAWREARTDALTGLANRKHLDAALRSAAAHALKHESVVSLIIADIDEFKAINDRYGHLVGDATLRQIAATLRDATRPTDLVARFGGEEFAIVLPGTDLRGGFGLADRLRHAVASAQLLIRHTGEGIGRVTISLGVAAYRHGETVAEWTQRADTALYEAKRAGRNRVIALERGAAPTPPPVPAMLEGAPLA